MFFFFQIIERKLNDFLQEDPLCSFFSYKNIETRQTTDDCSCCYYAALFKDNFCTNKQLCYSCKQSTRCIFKGVFKKGSLD